MKRIYKSRPYYKMFKTFLFCCCMKEKKEKKKKDKKKNVTKQKEEQVAIISCKSPTSKGSSSKAFTSKAPTSKARTLKTSGSTSELVFTSSSPILTLHRSTLPAVSTSSEDFCFYQVIYGLDLSFYEYS